MTDVAQLTVGSLFAGIGGFDLGLDRAGMRTAWFCEVDTFCQRILAKHWPDVPCYPDIRELRGVDVEPVDILCGGFPCQDISAAGKGAGLAGARSGLWSEYARLVGELRPRYVIVENVPVLRTRGLDRVLADLDACGYDAEWDGIPASTVGAPHKRDRIWIVAYPQREGSQGLRAKRGLGEGSGEVEADWRRDVRGGGRTYWCVEPDVGRVVDGVPDRVDRLTALGNALVPQIAEWIGRRIVEWEGVT
jgi:DNA (cytosine-5)-methyltransferase 1